MGSGAAKPLSGHCRVYDKKDGRTTFKETFLQRLQDLEVLYESRTEDSRPQLGQTLDGSYIVLEMCDTVVFETTRKCDQEQKDPERFKVLKRAMVMLEKLTRCNENVSATVVGHDRMIPVLLQNLGNEWKEMEAHACSPYTDEEKEVKDVLVPCSLSILYNMSTFKQHVSALRKLDAGKQSNRTTSPQGRPAIIDVMHTYLNALSLQNRLAAIAVIANTAKDNRAETEGVTTNPVLLALLVNAALRAVDNRRDMYKGWTAGQLLRVLRALGQKSMVKMPLLNADILKLLKKGIESAAEDIRKESMSILLDLSFDNDCARKIDKYKKIKEVLETMYAIPASPAYPDDQPDSKPDGHRTQINEAKKAYSILYLLSNEKNGEVQKVQEADQWDCFLSYNHASKPTVKKLYEFLNEQKIKVWMDDEDMLLGESVSMSMHEGVSRSKVFLLCASKKYAESQNCKFEARTANEQKKKIIPVLMERREAIKIDDSWLEKILHDRKYLDISQVHHDEGKFHGKVKELLKDLNKLLGKGKQKQTDQTQPKVETQTVTKGKTEAEATQQLPITGQDAENKQTQPKVETHTVTKGKTEAVATQQLPITGQDAENKRRTGPPVIRITPINHNQGRKGYKRAADVKDSQSSAGSEDAEDDVRFDRTDAKDASSDKGIAKDRSMGKTALYRRYERQLQPGISVLHSEDCARTEERTQTLHTQPTSSSLDEEKIRSWKSGEIQDWLQRSKLTSNTSPGRNTTYLTKCSLQMYHCHICRARTDMNDAVLTFKKKKLDELTGEELVFLHNLRKEAPEMFYKVLTNTLEIRSLIGTSRFIKALESLETV